jgi:hypothetical protein
MDVLFLRFWIEEVFRMGFLDSWWVWASEDERCGCGAII